MRANTSKSSRHELPRVFESETGDVVEHGNPETFCGKRTKHLLLFQQGCADLTGLTIVLRTVVVR